jgi:tetratricopeptide (TPR) repeat protein
MSLLLDALRRAEQDSKKRKLDAEAPAAAPDLTVAEPVAAQESAAPTPELTLEAQSPIPELKLEPEPEPEPESEPEPEPELAPRVAAVKSHSGFGGAEAAPDSSFLDFELPSDDAALPLPEAVIPASLAPRKAANPYGRYDRPAWEDSNSNWGALTANPVASKRPASDEARASGPVPIKPVARKSAEPSPERHAYARPADSAAMKSASSQAEATPASASHVASPRQALSAASVMAGRKKSSTRDAGGRRRQMVLVAVALLVALPLVAFLLFGDAMFGSSGGLGVASTPAAPVPVAINPVPTEPEPAASAAAAPAASVPDPATSAIAAATAVVPAPPPVPAVAAPRVAVANAAVRAAAPARSQAPRSAPVRASAPMAASAAPPAAIAGANRPASLMESAYAAYQAGNTVEAARLYREVLKADATQRDAWLGLAVIAHASNQLEPAMDAYRRVLRLEPQNATALAGVSSLSRAAGEPQQESRLRELLARSPQEADLNHALALVLSGEQRWSEAQPLFFKAHSLAPKEPQFAYNLAVALDHMRKSGLAAQYYETALGLAQGKAAGFDEANARSRLAALRGAR